MKRALTTATLVVFLLGIAWLGWRGRGEEPVAYQAAAPSAARPPPIPATVAGPWRRALPTGK